MTDTQGNETVEETLPTPIPSETKPAEATEPTLPDGVAERTAAEFEKLKQHNAELKTQLDSYKGKTSVLDDLKPAEVAPNLTPTQVDKVTSKFVDENGYVDVAKVENALRSADEVARQAKETADRLEKRIRDSEESAMVKVAHTEFPQLDPHSEKFDQKFYELTRNELIGQMMTGKQDIVEAARKVSQLYTQPVSKEADEHKAKVIKRDQATETPASRGKGEPTDQEELVRRTQSGDNNALFKRLQASGN